MMPKIYFAQSAVNYVNDKGQDQVNIFKEYIKRLVQDDAIDILSHRKMVSI